MKVLTRVHVDNLSRPSTKDPYQPLDPCMMGRKGQPNLPPLRFRHSRKNQKLIQTIRKVNSCTGLHSCTVYGYVFPAL